MTDPTTANDPASDPAQSPVRADSILIAEYEYIAQTAFQAHEDRARVTTFYLVTVGSLIGAMLTSQFTSNLVNVRLGFAALFLILAIGSFITLLQLVRLRQAWFDSAKAMNQIKAFYLTQLEEENKNLENAFLWSTATLPKREKAWSISFLLAIQVALLGAVLAGASVVFLGLALGFVIWWPALFVTLSTFFMHIWLFRRLLR
ncbi:MAG: hypothetical protein GXP41_10510 [Chloroflexi bacterium]|nr:hypothetical protein [Chloroflexota bacterium]